MANAPRFYAGGVKSAMDNLTALLNSGKLKICSGVQPAVDAAIGTVIATLTFGVTAFGASSDAGGTVTATANAITADTNAVGGTAGYFAITKSDDTVIATGSVSTSGADLNLNSVTISAGATVSCSSFSITQSQT